VRAGFLFLLCHTQLWSHIMLVCPVRGGYIADKFVVFLIGVPFSYLASLLGLALVESVVLC